MLVLMPEHRLICPISKNRSPDAHTETNNCRRENWDRGTARDRAKRHVASKAKAICLIRHWLPKNQFHALSSNAFRGQMWDPAYL